MQPSEQLANSMWCVICASFNLRVNVLNIIAAWLGWADHQHLTLSNSIWIFCINDHWKGPSCIRAGAQLCHWMPQSLCSLTQSPESSDVWQTYANVFSNRVFTFILVRHQREKLKQFPPCFRTLIVNWLTFRSFDVWIGILVFLPPVNTRINNK